MGETGKSNLEKKLEILQVTFKQQIPGRIIEIEELWKIFCLDQNNEINLLALHRAVHSFAGTGASFGAVELSAIAKELEHTLKFLLKDPDQLNTSFNAVRQQIDEGLVQLKLASDKKLTSDIYSNHPCDVVMKQDVNLLYLFIDDKLLTDTLLEKISKDDYQIQHFTELSDLEIACGNDIPAVIVMDAHLKDGSETIETLNLQLKESLKTCSSIVILSEKDSFEDRMAAAREGVSRYFTKPVDAIKLIQSITDLRSRKVTTPYKVLLVDDDETLLEFYATVLSDAEMEVQTLSNPLQCLEVLANFKPDIIVLDVYMPGCSGPELAQIIRQDDVWGMIPIMFLSVESDISHQLLSMKLGGKDFLVKPVGASHLVAAVIARAKQARETFQLNNKLKDTLRENKYQLVTMDQHDIVSVADVSGRITSVNDRFCAISGYTREELLGQNHRLLKSGYHPRSFYDDIWGKISNGNIWRGTICNHKKNGEEYWVESTIVPFLDQTGKPYKYVSARTDVTALIKSEDRLKRSQEFANIGTWDWNIKTGELFWSDRIWPLFGYEKENTNTTYDNFIGAIHPDDRQSVISAVSNCVDKGAEYNINHRVVWPDGSIRWLSENGNVIRNEDDVALHMLGVVRDITEQVSAEHELIHAREEAEDANRAKSKFLSSMSHELRTPMNAIMGFSQLLKLEKNHPLTESQEENVGEIVRASDHLLKLINEVLDLSKIEAGHIDLSIETVELGEVVGESLQLITPLAKKHGVEIELYRESVELSAVELLRQGYGVRADRTRLRQVLLNLLSNAVKYNCENGKIIITCEAVSNNQTRISITDSGKGLTEEQQSQLFIAFNRLGVEQSSIEGTGIGLVITKNIVELMGGNIGVVSKTGEGSTFWVELPSDSVNNELNISEDVPTAQVVNHVSNCEHTVLYIEDNPANLRLVTQLLGLRSNIHMWSAHEPLLGLELAFENNPDLILLDINLPGMDGFEVLKQLRLRQGAQKTPVIAISANAMPGDIEKGMAAGFDDYITKPIDVKKLLAAVDEVLKETE